jgi:hypothetical protein
MQDDRLNDNFRPMSRVELSLGELNSLPREFGLPVSRNPQRSGKGRNGERCEQRQCSVVRINERAETTDRVDRQIAIQWLAMCAGLVVWLRVFALLKRWGQYNARNENY